MNKPKRWSYSSLSTYQECPKKWYYSYIENIPWPASAAMERGTRMHKMAEDYVLGQIQVVPSEIRTIGPLLNQFRHTYAAVPEKVLLVDKNWEPTDDIEQAWVKVIIDVHYVHEDVLHVKDYKSGRVYPHHLDQLELYGLVGFLHNPTVKRVDTSAVYFDLGRELNESTILPGMIPKLIDKWEKSAQEMMNDHQYPPNAGSACRWCPYKRSAGGPCEDGR